MDNIDLRFGTLKQENGKTYYVFPHSQGKIEIKADLNKIFEVLNDKTKKIPKKRKK